MENYLHFMFCFLFLKVRIFKVEKSFFLEKVTRNQTEAQSVTRFKNREKIRSPN